MATRIRDAVDEADILPRSISAQSQHRATRELAYGQRRLLEIALALATTEGAAADEPAAGMPRQQGGELFRLSPTCRPTSRAVYRARYAVVFRLPARYRPRSAAALVEGTPSEIAADPRVREVIWDARPWRRCA
jgi:branched-chain amino acid transport system ATP-binding protein